MYPDYLDLCKSLFVPRGVNCGGWRWEGVAGKENGDYEDNIRKGYIPAEYSEKDLPQEIYPIL